MRDPEVFLFNEPLSNLDAKLRVQMRLEIARLHKEFATTMIYVTHDQVDGMRRGAADAIQVINRWHLLRDASDALPWVPARCGSVPEWPAAQAIARRMGLAPNTIRNRLRAGAAPTRRKGALRGRTIGPFPPHIMWRLEEGRHDASQLWCGIQARGLAGQVVGARARTAALKADTPFVAAGVAVPAWDWSPIRRTAHLLSCGNETAGFDGHLLTAVMGAVPEFGCAVAEARAFVGMVRERDYVAFSPWPERCRDGPPRGLAEGLGRTAVEAAPSLP